MIGCEVGSPSTMVLHYGHDLSNGKLKAWMKNDIATTMETLFARGL